MKFLVSISLAMIAFLNFSLGQNTPVRSISGQFHEKLLGITFGFGVGVGGRIGHFEGLLNYHKTDDGVRGGSIEIRAYPDKTNQKFAPYLGFSGVGIRHPHLFRNGTNVVPTNLYSLGLKMGYKWRFLKGAFFDLGYGSGVGLMQRLSGADRAKIWATEFYFHYAIGYEFIPKRHYSQPTPITSPFQNGFRHSFTIKSSWYRSTARQFTNVPDVPDLGISYGYFITPWLQGHLGFTIGNLPDYYNPENEDVGFKGLDGGIRVYGLQRKGWAYFVEGSYHYHQSEKRYMYLNHLHFGQYFSLKILENMDVLGGVGLNIFESDDVFSLELGVTVSPFGR